MVQLLHYSLYFLILSSYFYHLSLGTSYAIRYCYKREKEPMSYTKHMSELVPHAPFHTSAVQAHQLSLHCNNCLGHLLTCRDQWVTQADVRAGATCTFPHCCSPSSSTGFPMQ